MTKADLDQQSFERQLRSDRAAIDERLRSILEQRVRSTVGVQDAMEYVLLGGGKRLRALLCLWTHDAFCGEQRDACMDIAAAIECLHCYSLVHDDLPCMDDDDMRRGQPSCHKQFDEATAVLVGDALLTLCFEIIVDVGERHQVLPTTVVDVARIVARAAGTGGLITGQALDLMSDQLMADIATVEKIHRLKTAALIAAAMEAGAVIAGADKHTCDNAREAGILAGLAFQMIDDVLDVQTDSETLGKTAGKDARNGRLTHPQVAGIAGSQETAQEKISQARERLGEMVGTSPLNRLLTMLVERSY